VIDIRESATEDAAALARLAERTFREAFAHANRAEDIALHCRNSYGEEIQAAEIQRLYVDAKWHGKGVAHALMDSLLDAAVAGGADAVWLGVWERNPRAISFYAKRGFSVVGEHVFVVGSDSQRDLVLARSPDLMAPTARRAGH
jgi:GNAT superfamily N-acetyltransferase